MRPLCKLLKTIVNEINLLFQPLFSRLEFSPFCLAKIIHNLLLQFMVFYRNADFNKPIL